LAIVDWRGGDMAAERSATLSLACMHTHAKAHAHNDACMPCTHYAASSCKKTPHTWRVCPNLRPSPKNRIKLHACVGLHGFRPALLRAIFFSGSLVTDED
jgi:hypothetical protein